MVELGYKSWQRGVIIILVYMQGNRGSVAEVGHRPKCLTPESIALIHSSLSSPELCPHDRRQLPGTLVEKVGWEKG